MLKNKLRKWLDLPEPLDYKKYDQIVDRAIKAGLNEISIAKKEIERELLAVKCYVCKKKLRPDIEPIYTNFQGKKFCSHDCIDNNIGGKK